MFATVIACTITSYAQESCPFPNSEPYRETKDGKFHTVRCRCIAGFVNVGGSCVAADLKDAAASDKNGKQAAKKDACPPGLILDEGKCKQATCPVCTKALHKNVFYGASKARELRTYVKAAIDEYNNCKKWAGGVCGEGDILVRTLAACDNWTVEAAYRNCIRASVTQ